MATLQAAAVEAFGKPSSLQNMVLPVPGGGEILVMPDFVGNGLVVIGVADPLPDGWFAGCGIGSVGHQDMAEALPVADDHAHASLELHLLSAINSFFDRLEHGAVPSRVMIEFPS